MVAKGGIPSDWPPAAPGPSNLAGPSFPPRSQGQILHYAHTASDFHLCASVITTQRELALKMPSISRSKSLWIAGAYLCTEVTGSQLNITPSTQAKYAPNATSPQRGSKNTVERLCTGCLRVRERGSEGGTTSYPFAIRFWSCKALQSLGGYGLYRFLFT